MIWVEIFLDDLGRNFQTEMYLPFLYVFLCKVNPSTFANVRNFDRFNRSLKLPKYHSIYQ